MQTFKSSQLASSSLQKESGCSLESHSACHQPARRGSMVPRIGQWLAITMFGRSTATAVYRSECIARGGLRTLHVLCILPTSLSPAAQRALPRASLVSICAVLSGWSAQLSSPSLARRATRLQSCPSAPALDGRGTPTLVSCKDAFQEPARIISSTTSSSSIMAGTNCALPSPSPTSSAGTARMRSRCCLGSR